LKRHGLIELRRRRKRRDEFRRWERDRPMQLWQMDVMGGVLLDDDTELKVLTCCAPTRSPRSIRSNSSPTATLRLARMRGGAVAAAVMGSSMSAARSSE
jgi:hypothetical protein